MWSVRGGAGGSRVVFSVMRVMFVMPGDGAGCSMIFARRQAASLREAGVDVREFFLRSRTSVMVMAREMMRFKSIARGFRPDVVHAHFGTVTGMFAALGCGRTPLVITYRGSDLNPVPDSRVRSAAGHFLSQIAALRARRMVCVSAELKGRLWWRRSCAVVMASGVDAAAFRPVPKNEARQRLGWPAAERVVLFNAGHDSKVKRLDLAREAVRLARLEIPDLRWEVVDGSMAPERMPDVMNAADCLLLTSDHEGSPSVVQEALATNLPIVSVDVGDVRERVDGVRHTRVVEREAGSLGRAIVEVVREPVRSDGVSKISEIGFARIAGRMLEIYGQAVGSGN